MNALELLVVLYAFSLSTICVSSLITCSNCHTDSDFSDEICSTECEGDVCYAVQYLYDGGASTFSDSGCLVGSAAELGCRTNQDGAIMCLCDTPQCNINKTSLSEAESELLPLAICERKRDDGFKETRRWTKPCASSFCSYERDEYNLLNETHASEILGCSKENDFDIFSPGIFLYYPNNCVRLHFPGHPNQLSCYGREVNGLSASYPNDDEFIECYVDFYTQSLPYIRTGEICKGQMCFISSTVRGDVYRGCATFADDMGGEAMRDGYFRSYTGIEQWICSKDRCNFDLNTAELTWPDTEEEHRNISRLRQWNIFYVINGAPVSSKNSWFFLTIFYLFVNAH